MAKNESATPITARSRSGVVPSHSEPTNATIATMTGGSASGRAVPTRTAARHAEWRDRHAAQRDDRGGNSTTAPLRARARPGVSGGAIASANHVRSPSGKLATSGLSARNTTMPRSAPGMLMSIVDGRRARSAGCRPTAAMRRAAVPARCGQPVALATKTATGAMALITATTTIRLTIQSSVGAVPLRFERGHGARPGGSQRRRRQPVDRDQLVRGLQALLADRAADRAEPIGQLVRGPLGHELREGRRHERLTGGGQFVRPGGTGASSPSAATSIRASARPST